MATSAPDDLLAFRAVVMAVTGLTNPVEVGIVGDTAHEERGGYHISGDGINAKGNFNTDYSTKRTRDHFLPNPNASAMDIGDNWPRGGRAAWLRFGNNVAYELIYRPTVLPALRAINYSPNGTDRCRYDTYYPNAGIVSSADTVDIHTHLEFWRDTIGNRDATLRRLHGHLIAARDSISLGDALAQLDETRGDTSTQGGTGDMFVRDASTGKVYIASSPLGRDLSGAEWSGVPSSIKVYVDFANMAAIKQVLPDPTSNPVDVAALAAALAPMLDGVDEATVVAALESPAGQAALTGAANVAEDS